MTTKSTTSGQADEDNIFNGPHETMGQYLKLARTEQGKTLEAVSETTCIHIATIQALEEDDYEKLPAEVFVRGFIKIYANHLNLDAEKALSLYQPVPDSENTDFSKRKGARRRILPGERLAEASPFTTSRQLLIFALFIMFALFALKVLLPTRQPETNGQKTATTVEETTLGDSEQQESQTDQVAPEQSLADSSAILPPETADEPSSSDKQEAFKTELTPGEAQSTPSLAVQDTKATEPPKPQVKTPDGTTAAERLIIVPHKKKITRKPKEVLAEGSVATDAPQDGTNDKPPATDSASETPAKNATESAKSTATDKPASKDKSEKKPAPFVYTLKATFTDLTWLEVTVDGGPIQSNTFRSGSKWEWQARKEIKLNIGNAGGVHLTLNNKALPPLGEPGESVEITLPNKSR